MNSSKRGTLIAAMIPTGVALNWVVASTVQALQLPLFLNNIGSMLNAIVLGPIWGIVTASLTNTLLGLTVRWTFFPFQVVGWAIALTSYLFFILGWYKNLPKVLVAGAVTGIVSTVFSTIISTTVFGGFTGHPSDMLTAAMVASGKKIFAAAFIGNLPSQVLDKVIDFWVVWMILRLFPTRYLPDSAKIKKMVGVAPANPL
ncbi:MAG: hypothetical protein M1598_06775 [Actinobacteria bacterium]|nr:hypothetical protein [Actinomycetota bacterium]